MSPFASQTREVAFLIRFFRMLKTAKGTGVWAPVEALIDPQAFLRTKAGVTAGAKAVLQHLQAMQEHPFQVSIVAPKGGLITVLVSSMDREGQPVNRGHEQVYRILRDHLVELIDLGRTPQQVYRPESQPN